MTTGRINQIAVKFSRRRARTHECRVCGERGGSNPLAGVEKPESQRRRSFPKIGKTGVVSGSTAPGADLQETEARSGRPLPMPTVSRHGCFFHKTYHANGLCTLLQTRIAVRRGEEKTRSSSPSPHRAAHIRLWPVCSFEGKKKDNPSQSMPKSINQKRPAGLASCTVPVCGGRGLSDCFPKRAQSPSTRPCPRGLHRAEGLVRLVLRCVVLVHIV